MAIIQEKCERSDSLLPDSAASLLLDGNCIPLALYRLGRCHIENCVNEQNAINTTAKENRARTYRQCEEIYTVGMTPFVGVDLDTVGSYLIHMEVDGKPHCVACNVCDDNGNCTI